MKKKNKYLCLCLTAAILMLSACQRQVKQGEYEGVSGGYSGPIKVSVEVDQDGKISEIKILEQSETPGLGDKALEITANEIVKKNSTDLVAVSGATSSSYGLINAVNRALYGKNTRLREIKETSSETEKEDEEVRTEAQTEAKLENTGQVTEEGLNLRKEASPDSESLASLSQGSPVIILKSLDGSDGNKWYKIKSSDGQEGFVSSKYITNVSSDAQPVEPPKPQEDSLYKEEKSGRSTDGPLNIRENPSTNSKSLGKLAKGKDVKVLGETKSPDEKVWYIIKTDSIEKGYVSSDYIEINE